MTIQHSAPSVEFAWMWRVRWAALSGQVLALLLAEWVFELQLPLTWMMGLVGLQCASNLLLPRGRPRVERSLLATTLFLDVCVFSVLLSFSGGAGNPFSSFYVVYVAMAALVLGGDWALSLVVLTSLAYGALFWVPAARHGVYEWSSASVRHLQCMWMAYVLAASFVAYFVSRVARALREREARMRQMQSYTAAVERVASLSTMAAGAAHELGTPLSAIAVSAGELASALESEPRWHGFAQEAREIRVEVDRCRHIIDQMSARAGQPSAEVPVWFTPQELLREVLLELSSAARERVVLALPVNSAERVRLPRRGLLQVVLNLVRNALEASESVASREPVELSVAVSAQLFELHVRDRGCGIPQALAARLGEPFFTTKGPGKGMGLGLYLVRTFAQHLGGSLQLGSRPGGGAEFTLRLPLDSVNHAHSRPALSEAAHAAARA